MGFVVDQNIVLVDHSIDDYAVTEARKDRSPCIGFYKKNSLSTYSIYYRTGQRRGSLGDNCPFLYALKKRDDLSTNRKTIRNMRKEFILIVNMIKKMIINNHMKVDYIVPMPSSHPYASHLSKIIKRIAFPNAVIRYDLLVKKENDEMMKEVQELNISGKNISIILSSIRAAAKQNKRFTVSSIETRLRQNISPLKIVGNVKPGNYLLIDDLIASGSTIISAKEVIQKQENKTDVFALSLFSSLNNRTRS